MSRCKIGDEHQGRIEVSPAEYIGGWVSGFFSERLRGIDRKEDKIAWSYGVGGEVVCLFCFLWPKVMTERDYFSAHCPIQVKCRIEFILSSGFSLLWKTGSRPGPEEAVSAQSPGLVFFWELVPHWKLEWQPLPWRWCSCQAQLHPQPWAPNTSTH